MEVKKFQKITRYNNSLVHVACSTDSILLRHSTQVFYPARNEYRWSDLDFKKHVVLDVEEGVPPYRVKVCIPNTGTGEHCFNRTIPKPWQQIPNNGKWYYILTFLFCSCSMNAPTEPTFIAHCKYVGTTYHHGWSYVRSYAPCSLNYLLLLPAPWTFLHHAPGSLAVLAPILLAP